MGFKWIISHWALVAASIVAFAVFLKVLKHQYENSTRGRLNARVSELKQREQEAKRALRHSDKAAERLAGMRNKADKLTPRLLAEAEEALQDTSMLRKIADDQVLVAQRRVRDIILEEFPPNRQDGLRSKYQ
jgi:hypothetical protein